MNNQYKFHIKIQGIVKPSPIFETESESKTFEGILKSILELFPKYQMGEPPKQNLKIFFFFKQSWLLITDEESAYIFFTSNCDYLKLQINRFQLEQQENSHEGYNPSLPLIGDIRQIISLRTIQNNVSEKKIQPVRDSDSKQQQNRKEIIQYTDVERCLKNELTKIIEIAGKEFIKQLQQQQNQDLQTQQDKLNQLEFELEQLQDVIRHKQDQYDALLIQLSQQEQQLQINQSQTQLQIEQCEAQYVQIIQIQNELQCLREHFIEKSNILAEQLAIKMAGRVNDPADYNDAQNKVLLVLRQIEENLEKQQQKHHPIMQTRNFKTQKQKSKQSESQNIQQYTPLVKKGRQQVQKNNPPIKLPKIKNIFQQT